MDQELTGNAFKRFMRRRGLSRDQRGDEFSEDPPTPPRLHRTPSHHRGDQQPVPHRTSSSHGIGNASRTNPTSSQPANIRRTQSTIETNQGSPRRRRREDAEEPSKKQYRCEYCNLQFGRKHHKERHVANIHRQEKPYVCNMCGHPFHQKPNLDRHRATVHSEVSPFRCEECGLTFSRRSVLRNHVQTLHDRSRRHECPVCRQVFIVGRDLTTHVRTSHPGHSGQLHNRTSGSSSLTRERGPSGPVTRGRGT